MQRSVLSFVIGVVLAVIAVSLTYYLMSNRAPRAVDIDTVNVVVTTEALSFGAPVNRNSLKVVPWPRNAVPEGVFTSPDDIFADMSSRHVALTAIAPGEPVLKSKISGFGKRPIMSEQLAEGMRAFSVSINDVSGVAGFLLPGDRVDVLLTRDIGNGNQNLVTDVVLQNIKVLGIDQLADQADDKPVVARTATVEVTTEQAQKLALAQKVGTLNLALRNVSTPDDLKISQVRESDLANKSAPRHTSSGPSGPGVRVRYGSEAVTTRSVQP